MKIVSVRWLSLCSFILFFYHFPLFSQLHTASATFAQSGDSKSRPFSPVPLPCVYNSSCPSMSNSTSSPSAHHPSLPVTPHAAFPPTPVLSTPPHAACVALTGPWQQGAPCISHPNLCFHTSHPRTLSQVQSTSYPAHHPEPELAEQPVQVNM